VHKGKAVMATELRPQLRCSTSVRPRLLAQGMAALETNYKPTWTWPHFGRLVQIARDGNSSELADGERWQHEWTLSSAFATTASPETGHSVRHMESQDANHDEPL
jgi:hypothetical protein